MSRGISDNSKYSGLPEDRAFFVVYIDKEYHMTTDTLFYTYNSKGFSKSNQQ